MKVLQRLVDGLLLLQWYVRINAQANGCVFENAKLMAEVLLVERQLSRANHTFDRSENGSKVDPTLFP